MTPEDIAIRSLLEAVWLATGYDFRRYSMASVRRRVLQRVQRGSYANVSALQHAVLTDSEEMRTLVLDFSINTTEMFRDPPFWRALRQHVIPHLRTFPFVRVWVAGCSSGEELYSLAIILEEEGLLDRARLYATDFNPAILEHAREGIFPAARMADYAENHAASGSLHRFEEYCTVRYEQVLLDRRLSRTTVFSDHNLATDAPFGEMQLVLCRNVLIYFDKELQGRVLRLLRDSLCHGGVLCLGNRETLRFAACEAEFEALVPDVRVYRRTSS